MTTGEAAFLRVMLARASFFSASQNMRLYKAYGNRTRTEHKYILLAHEESLELADDEYHAALEAMEALP